MNRRLTAGLLLLALLPTIAQEEEADEERGPYFSVATSRSYGPGDTPVVQLWASTGIEKLQFRVYRVQDPVKFYANLREETRSGGSRARRPQQLTPIERVHRWKLRARARIRNVVRSQYTPESRSSIRGWMSGAEPQPSTPQASQYAAVPVLNPQQVVQVWEQPVSRKNRWDSQTIPIPVENKGLYLVEVTDGKLQAYTVVSVTGLALMTKGSPGRVLARVVDRASGAPTAGAAVLARMGEKELAKAETGADGTASLTINEPKPEQVVVLARQGEDFAAITMYGYSLRSSEDGYWTGYIHTDRPVYRPGHKVHFRGILRIPSASGYDVPAGREVTIEVQDSDAKSIAQRKLTVSPMGTIRGDFEIPSTAALGYYDIQVRAGDSYMTGGFHVEEYRKPEYEVRVTPSSRRVIQGEAVEALIEARYYYGEPVTGAKAAWVVHRTRYWIPDYADDEMPEEGEGEYYAGEQVADASGALNAEGKLTIRIPTTAGPHDYRYRIEARVTDASNREIAGAVTVVATQGSYHVHIRPSQYVYAPNSRAKFQIEARDYEGNAVAGAVVRVSLAESRWREKERPLPGETEGRTDPQGNAVVDVALPGAGSYVAYVRSKTPEGRDVSGSTWIWITGEYSFGRGTERVTIVPDKKSYKPGDVAKVLVLTGVPGAHVWIGTEANTVHTTRTVAARGGSVAIDVPILPEYAPNFFVVASFLKNGQLCHGVKSLKVPPADKQLQVTVRSSKAEYKPGEEGLFTVEARDHLGKPVAAEFSIGVVDEAIYAIRREPVEDIVRFFYGRRHNRISLDTSLSFYFHGEAGKRRMQLARVRPLGSRAQLKPERLVEPRVRKAFPDTIYWAADVMTDAAGRAQARVSFPDSLTTWRATARGVTRQTQVGGALHRAIVRKNLVLSLATPRFLREGDTVTVSAIVRNYLAAGKTVRVSLDARGVEVLEGGTRDITVAPKEQAKVDFRLRAQPGREVVLTGRALTDEESDAMEIALPVRPYGVELTEAKAGALGEMGTQADARHAFPADAAPSSRLLEIRVAPSLAGAILGALDHLTSFPYGCTEQTMSSFLPNVIVSRAAKELGLKGAVDDAALRQKIRAGLERLADYQHEDGGWGWWKTDDSDRFMTAYVLSGLKSAREAGYPVSSHQIEQASKWLAAEWEKMTRAKPDLRAYVAWALGDKTRIEPLWAERSSLSPYALSLAGLTLQQAGDARAGEIAAMLERAAVVDEREAHWRAERDDLMDIYIDASPEVTAWAIKFLARQNPKSPLLPKAALYLVTHRDQGPYWVSTKQTAMVIHGLTDYLKQSGELKPDLGFSVTVNDREVLSRRFSESDALSPAPVVIALDASKLGGAAEQRVRIRMTGQGRLYWSTRSSYYSASRKLAPQGNVSLGVSREYFRLVPSREGEKIVYRLEPLSGAAQTGDLLAARLTLDGRDWRYLMIEDPIPAGAELIERDDLYELSPKPDWWRSWFTRRELRDDRAAIFQTFVERGPREYFYLMKITNAGQFRVSPARVQPMYQPQHAASTEGFTLEVR